MRPRRIKRIAWALFLTAATSAGLAMASDARADTDPYVPAPPLWCPGNDPGAFVASGYGGYCEGRSYPDGTRWNTYRVGWFWQPLKCITFDGTAFPPVAPPGGCGGNW